MINIPVSVGELMDKWVILKIKSVKVTDQAKLGNITTELELLNDVAKPYQYDPKTGEAVTALLAQLYDVNSMLWVIEDELRDLERQKVPDLFFSYFDADGTLDAEEGVKVRRFVELAREVYFTNDKRCAIKRTINDLCGSDLIEEKSYEEY